MKKILLVSLSKNFGGIERLFHNLFVNNVKDYHLDIITFHEKCAYQEDFEKEGYKVYSLPSRSKKKFAFSKVVKEFLSEHNDYDYIWVNTASTSMYEFQYWGKRLTNAKIITHSHGTESEKNGNITDLINSILAKLNYKKVIKNTDIFLACSKKAGIALFGKKYSDKIILLNNLIDVQKFVFNNDIRHDIRKKYNINDNKFVISVIGRLSNQKNIPFAMEIIKDVAKSNDNVAFFVTGDGELKSFAENFVKEHSLCDKVVFTGNVLNVQDYYSVSDILITPSFFEGFPLSVVEAQSNGLKCILSDKITIETKLTDLVEFLPITDGVNIWVDKINQILKNYDFKDFEKRKNYNKIIIEKKFDIKDANRLLKEILN